MHLFPDPDRPPAVSAADRRYLEKAHYVESQTYPGWWYAPGRLDRRLTTAEALAELDGGARPEDRER
jgi:hypothetical protein